MSEERAKQAKLATQATKRSNRVRLNDLADVHERCAGIDVHKGSVTVCVSTGGGEGELREYPKQEWRKPPAARNEALDCRVYAYAALQALYASGLKLGVQLRPLREDGWLAAQGSEDDSADDGRGECSAPRASGTAGKRSAHPCAVRARGAMDTAPQLVWRQMTWL